MIKTRFSRWGSPAIFAGIVLAFLLPFATVSCGDEEVTFTGVELATWQVPHTEPEPGDEPLSNQVESGSSHWALVALIAAAIGLGLGIAGRRGGGIAAAVGLAAILFLLWDAVSTLADIQLHSGFGLASLGYTAAGTVHARAARRRRRDARGIPPRPKSWRRRFVVIGLILLVLAALAGCGALMVAAEEDAEPEYVDFGTADSSPAWSSRGEIAFARDGSVYTVKRDGSCPREVTAGGEPAWSPTGDRLAVTRCGDNACSIFVVSRDGSGARKLVSGRYSAPVWSADGTQLYLSHEEEDSSTSTWVVRADGSGLRRLTPPWVERTDERWSPAAAGEDDPTFSPNGKSYAFASSDDPTVGIDALEEAIFIRSVRGGERRQLSDPPEDAGDYDPAWSPDGKQISFQRSGEIAVMDADGSHQRVVTNVDGATTSAWSPDGREIVFTRELYGGDSYFAEPSALMIVDSESGDTRRLTWGPSPVAACKSR